MRLSDAIAEKIFTRAILNERFKAGHGQQIMKLLEELSRDLSAELTRADPTGVARTQFQQRRLEKLFKETDEIIRGVYHQIKDYDDDAMRQFARIDSRWMKSAFNAAVDFNLANALPTYEVLNAIVKKAIVMGHPASTWWARQSPDLQNRFEATIRDGVLRGEPVGKLMQRVRGTRANNFTDGITSVSRRNANSWIRTSIQNVSNQARRQTYLENSKLISGEEWFATLDQKTTPICRVLDGRRWTLESHDPVGHGMAYRGHPPIHWNCRSTTLPVIMKWDEIYQGVRGPQMEARLERAFSRRGLTPDAARAKVIGIRESMDGAVSRDLNFESWLRQKPIRFQNELLGRGKARLWRENRITFSQMVDQSNRPLTLAQLEAIAEPDPLVSILAAG